MWQQIKTFLLKVIVGYIVGKDVFTQIQNLVEEVALNNELTGAQKKDKVLAKAKEMGIDFTTNAINLAIETSVTLLKEKVGAQESK